MPVEGMIDFLAGMFYVVNPEGRLVLWNKRVEIATQLPADELREISVLDLFGEEEKGLVREKIREVFDSDGEVLVEANLLSRNRPSVPFLFTGARFRAGDRYYLCGMGLDVTQRRRQEEQLRLRERALHATSNGIVIMRCVANRSNT